MTIYIFVLKGDLNGENRSGAFLFLSGIYVIGCYKVMVPLPECLHIAKSLQDESDRRLISCIVKLFKPLDNIRRVTSLARDSSITST